MEEMHIEKDKVFAPYLLAASFNGLVEFKGYQTIDGVVIWKFMPKNKSLELIDQFQTKTEPTICAKDLFEAIETFWKTVSKTRNVGMNHAKKLPIKHQF